MDRNQVEVGKVAVHRCLAVLVVAPAHRRVIHTYDAGVVVSGHDRFCFACTQRGPTAGREDDGAAASMSTRAGGFAGSRCAGVPFPAGEAVRVDGPTGAGEGGDRGGALPISAGTVA